MCGIFLYKSKNLIDEKLYKILLNNSDKITHRGPDNTQYLIINNIFLAFYRLRINDMSDKGDQPLLHPTDSNLILICNGEIYNYEKLKKKYKFNTYSVSDCEIILHLYKKFGFKKTIEMLDGVFACVLIDKNTNIIYSARDPIGVRSMFIGKNANGEFAFSSEMKSINDLCEDIQQFKPGHIWNSKTMEYECYYNKNELYNNALEESSIGDIKQNIKNLFTEAVNKRLMSDRPIGCLLSGGLDSSLVAAILKKNYNKPLHTFSIGLNGSPDLKYAKIVADHIGSIHHEVVVTEEEMINAIEEDIYQIETYDTTTIRASVPMLLLSKYIKNNTDITVIYSGEGSDEASGSYLYFHNSPNQEEFKTETIRLMEDLHYFDVLRCDKSTAIGSLEVRVPFLDKDFLNYYMNIDSKYKITKFGGIEKFLLRESFNNDNLLPDEVLWRIKEGMSDGVSSKKRGWYEIIQEYTETIYTDDQFKELQNKYSWNPPRFKEALYFRELFNKHFPGREKTIPYYWLPKWSGDIIEPSARVLIGVYEE